MYVRALEVVSNRPVEGRKTVTVPFCDLVAYTELAGRLDPEALRHLVLLFFERAATEIEEHGGTVEKFVGDEVMAVFGVHVRRRRRSGRDSRCSGLIRRNPP